jgi:hypothetical protein
MNILCENPDFLPSTNFKVLSQIKYISRNDHVSCKVIIFLRDSLCDYLLWLTENLGPPLPNTSCVCVCVCDTGYVIFMLYESQCNFLCNIFTLQDVNPRIIDTDVSFISENTTDSIPCTQSYNGCHFEFHILFVNSSRNKIEALRHPDCPQLQASFYRKLWSLLLYLSNMNNRMSVAKGLYALI